MKTRPVLFALALLIVPALALAHGGHKHVSGTIASVGEASIVVKTSTGNVSVSTSPETKYFRGSDTKHPTTADELKTGMRVVVHLGGDGKALEVHIPSGA